MYPKFSTPYPHKRDHNQHILLKKDWNQSKVWPIWSGLESCQNKTTTTLTLGDEPVAMEQRSAVISAFCASQVTGNEDVNRLEGA